jgi:hypothetical protein
MHKTTRTGFRTKSNGRRRAWRMIFGSVAVLFVALAFKAPRLAVRGDVRRGSAPFSGELVKTTPEGELVLPPAAHERAELGRRFIGGAFGVLLLSLLIVTLGVLWLFPLPGTDRTLQVPLPPYPEPRLQPSPRQEMQRFLAAESEQLTTYGWVDKAHQIVRIPIDVAMKRVAERGIPDWPTTANPATGESAIAVGPAP